MLDALPANCWHVGLRACASQLQLLRCWPSDCCCPPLRAPGAAVATSMELDDQLTQLAFGNLDQQLEDIYAQRAGFRSDELPVRPPGGGKAQVHDDEAEPAAVSSASDDGKDEGLDGDSSFNASSTASESEALWPTLRLRHGGGGGTEPSGASSRRRRRAAGTRADLSVAYGAEEGARPQSASAALTHSPRGVVADGLQRGNPLMVALGGGSRSQDFHASFSQRDLHALLHSCGTSVTQAQMRAIYSASHKHAERQRPSSEEREFIGEVLHSHLGGSVAEFEASLSTLQESGETGHGGIMDVHVQSSYRAAPTAAEAADALEGGCYAMLRCRAEGWTYAMRQPAIVLGRRGADGTTVADVALGDRKSISRRHAVISVVGEAPLQLYAAGTGLRPQLALDVLGKNFLYLNHVLYRPNEGGTVELQHGDQLRIGGVEVQLLLPGEPPPPPRSRSSSASAPGSRPGSANPGSRPGSARPGSARPGSAGLRELQAQLAVAQEGVESPALEGGVAEEEEVEQEQEQEQESGGAPAPAAPGTSQHGDGGSVGLRDKMRRQLRALADADEADADNNCVGGRRQPQPQPHHLEDVLGQLAPHLRAKTVYVHSGSGRGRYDARQRSGYGPPLHEWSVGISEVYGRQQELEDYLAAVVRGDDPAPVRLPSALFR
jgi:hypothetical protein